MPASALCRNRSAAHSPSLCPDLSWPPDNPVELISPEDERLGGVTSEMARRWQLLQELQNRNETLFYKVRVPSMGQV